MPTRTIDNLSFTVFPPSLYLTKPWISIRSGELTITPNITRETATVLRAMADDMDALWAKIDAAGPEQTELAVPA